MPQSIRSVKKTTEKSEPSEGIRVAFFKQQEQLEGTAATAIEFSGKAVVFKKEARDFG